MKWIKRMERIKKKYIFIIPNLKIDWDLNLLLHLRFANSIEFLLI
jgi:hypothetical protein